MALYDDIDALYARSDLTDAEKRAQANALKAGGLRDALVALGALPITFPSFQSGGATYVVSITRIELRDSMCYVWGTIFKNGVLLRRRAVPASDTTPAQIVNLWPVVFPNPALLVLDAGGTVSRNGTTWRFDPAFLARQQLQGLAILPTLQP